MSPPIHTDGGTTTTTTTTTTVFVTTLFSNARAPSTKKVYWDEVYFDCSIDDEKCSHFLCGASDVVVVIFLSVLRIVDDFIPFHVGLIEMTRALETRSVVRALHVEY